MTLIKIVQNLIKEGHKIQYRVRHDGGIIVTKIGGTKYSGAQGNKIARKLAGSNLTEAQQRQRTSNVKQFIKLGTPENPQKRRVKALDKDLKKTLRRVQKKWRESLNDISGQITSRKVKWHIQHEGVEGAKSYLDRMEKRAEGFAYAENISGPNGLSNRMRAFARNPIINKSQKSELERIADWLDENDTSIKDKLIQYINQIMYNTRTKGEVANCIARIKQWLKI